MLFDFIFLDRFLVFWLVILLWNILTFLLMGLDKLKSSRGHWRISEATLLTSAFLMGGIGSWLGSAVFRHKSRKIKFMVLLPISVVVNFIIVYLIIKYIVK